jgi:hypothetical protein
LRVAEEAGSAATAVRLELYFLSGPDREQAHFLR